MSRHHGSSAGRHEDRGRDDHVLEIDAFTSYGRRPAAPLREPASPVGAPSRAEARSARPRGVRFAVLAAVAALLTGTGVLATTIQRVMTPSESSDVAAATGPIDMTAGVDDADGAAGAIETASVRQIPLGRSGAVAGAAGEVAAAAVPLPRLRPERAVAEATSSAGSLAAMETRTVRPMAADPDPELVARVERALAEAPPDPVAMPPVAMPSAAMPSAAPARAPAPAAVFAGAEPAAPSDTTPLPAGIKLPPAEIPFAPTGSV